MHERGQARSSQRRKRKRQAKRSRPRSATTRPWRWRWRWHRRKFGQTTVKRRHLHWVPDIVRLRNLPDAPEAMHAMAKRTTAKVFRPLDCHRP